jgi:outer membrane immunogenic protein
MRWLSLSAVGALAFLASHPALSADLGPIAPVYKTAPVAPQTPFFTWTGCFVGAHAGGGLQRKTFTDTGSAPHLGGPLDVDARQFSFDPSGFVGGGQFGCNYQFAQEWVVGVEADIEGTDIVGSKTDSHSRVTDTTNTTTTVTTFELGAHSKSTWLGSATARIGWAPGPWFIYVKGGGAWISDKYNADLTAVDTITTSTTTITSSPTTLGVWNASETRSGWTFGGGVEYAFLTYWSVRGDYNFYYFGNHNVEFTGIDSRLVNVRQWMSVFSVGISYRFGPGSTSYYY